MSEIKIMNVKSSANVRALAGAIYNSLENPNVEIAMVAIGPAAVNQAVKAVAVAREYVSLMGIDLTVTPAFIKVEVDGGVEKNAIQLLVAVK
jgi:stage V sporulation protein S